MWICWAAKKVNMGFAKTGLEVSAPANYLKKVFNNIWGLSCYGFGEASVGY